MFWLFCNPNCIPPHHCCIEWHSQEESDSHPGRPLELPPEYSQEPRRICPREHFRVPRWKHPWVLPQEHFREHFREPRWECPQKLPGEPVREYRWEHLRERSRERLRECSHEHGWEHPWAIPQEHFPERLRESRWE